MFEYMKTAKTIKSDVARSRKDGRARSTMVKIRETHLHAHDIERAAIWRDKEDRRMDGFTLLLKVKGSDDLLELDVFCADQTPVEMIQTDDYPTAHFFTATGNLNTKNNPLIK